MVEDYDVFINGVIEDEEGIDLNVIDYGVNFGENGVGGGSGGLECKVNNNETIVEWELSEDNKEIFQVESDAWQEQLLVQLEFSQNYWLT